jgi:hypothetical protein
MMKNAQNITVMLLVVTAATLTTLLGVSWLYTEPAYAGAGPAKDGDYIMAAGSYNDQSDFLYIVDIANAKLNIYYADINTNSIRLGDTVDLGRAFGAAAAPPKR